MGGVDELDVNIAILNNHTRNRAITGLITPIWIVFANAQRAALANAKASFKIRHTERAADRVQKAREQLGLTWKYITEFEVQAERLINETLTEAEFRKICDQIWTPPTNTATERTKTVGPPEPPCSAGCLSTPTPTPTSAALAGPATRPLPST